MVNEGVPCSTRVSARFLFPHGLRTYPFSSSTFRCLATALVDLSRSARPISWYVGASPLRAM